MTRKCYLQTITQLSTYTLSTQSVQEEILKMHKETKQLKHCFLLVILLLNHARIINIDQIWFHTSCKMSSREVQKLHHLAERYV